jgi:hypothetical protein
MRSRCVFGNRGSPRAAARQDTGLPRRWFGGGRRTRSSSGTRPAHQHSRQCATRGRSEDTENDNLRHHLCVIYLTETCCRQNNSSHVSKVDFIVLALNQPETRSKLESVDRPRRLHPATFRSESICAAPRSGFRSSNPPPSPALSRRPEREAQAQSRQNRGGLKPTRNYY